MNDDIRFLKESDLFKGMPPEVLQQVYGEGKIRHFGPGEVIFKEGDTHFDFYIIQRGVVEIRKTKWPENTPTVVAYLSEGECIGEMALITGRPRSATACVPQEADLLQISAEKYEELIHDTIFLRRLCEILAYRLEHTDARLAGASRKVLQGSLHYFDIATVMQTLINSGQSGVMVIETPDQVRADVVFCNGQIYHARLGTLEGEEAFYQIFQVEMNGDFSFKGEDVHTLQLGPPIGKHPMSLLLEAMRMKDEVKVFLTGIDSFEQVFHPSKDTLVWLDETTLDTALMIWMKMLEGATLKVLLNDIPRCTYTILSIINRMQKEGLIE